MPRDIELRWSCFGHDWAILFLELLFRFLCLLLNILCPRNHHPEERLDLNYARLNEFFFLGGALNWLDR